MAFEQLLARADTDPGSHRGGGSNSASSIISTLVPNLLIALAFITLFFIFRAKFPRVYAPRTYIDSLGPERKTPPPSSSMFGWITDFKKIDDRYILDHQSIDGYLFVRYFKLIVVISLLGCCICMPVLFPVNATGGGGHSQLDILAFGNVSIDHANRWYAHAFVSWIFLGLVMIIIARESFFAVNIRQAYRRSAWGASRLSARTVLFTGIPKNITQADLFKMFPGGVSHAWVASNCKALEKLIEDRDNTAFKLEDGEIKLCTDANNNRLKAAKGKKAYQGNDADGGAKWLNPKDRPTHRLKPLIGKKVDTIEYGRQHLAEILPKIQQEQEKHLNGQGDIVGAVFVEFDTQKSAQDAWQLMTDVRKKPSKKIVAQQLGVLPQEVVWGNLRISLAEHWVRWAIATAFISVMIIFWAIPVAVVGIISNINYITEKVTWLSWIDKIPHVILGVVTGLLPVVMLAVLMALVPIICRLVAKLAGYVTLSQVELQTQSWYFAFQVIQVFLITTMTSAATSVVQSIINDPASALGLLAESLPTASNFYISYFILFGLSSFAGTLLNIGGFVTVVLLGRVLPGKTPRKIFQKLTTLSAPMWGSEFPKWVNLGVIAITYSCIAPLILAFSLVGMSLIYVAFRYSFLYTVETNIDTKGAAYQRAIQQLTTGVYLSEICLIGLFAISVGANRAAIGPLVVEVVLLAMTILFHVTLKRALVSHEARLAYTDPVQNPHFNNVENGQGAVHSQSEHPEKPTDGANGTAPNVAPKASRLPVFLQKIVNPEKHSEPSLAATLAPFYHQPQQPLPVEVSRRAFFNPAVTSETPTIWIVRDEMGISKREIEHTSRAVPGLKITDEDAIFNEKGKVEWGGVKDGIASKAPVYEERILY